ncbi:MAG: LapA family protein [Aquificaceae bacterium]|nr:LapA family protein [Aquificaceae bacterium]
MSPIKFLVVLSLLVLFLLFIAQNAGYAEISFFYATYKVPLFVLLLTSFSIGFLLPSFYFLFKEALLKRRLHQIEEGLREWSRGYLGRAEKLLSSARDSQGVRVFLAKLLWKQGKADEAMSINFYVCPVLEEALLKQEEGNLEESLKEVVLKDPENLRALKKLRDFYALRDRWETALEYQEKVLELCEKWERDVQKKVKAEIMAKLYLSGSEDKFIEKAVDIYTTPFIHAVYIKHLLKQDKSKDAKKHLDKISSGHLEEVLWHLMEDQEALTRLLSAIETKAGTLTPDTLAMVYIKLNLPSKVKEMEDNISSVTRSLFYSTFSHKEQDKYCLEALRELSKPFFCTCGKAYNNYTPLCVRCGKWGEIKMRRAI